MTKKFISLILIFLAAVATISLIKPLGSPRVEKSQSAVSSVLSSAYSFWRKK